MDNFYTQSFQDFAAGVKPLDLALYAGAGLVIWVLFQEKLGGVKDFVSRLLNKVSTQLPTSLPSSSSDDIFFKLITSWKETRDLAIQSGCLEAVKTADAMFPLLNPSVCQNTKPETEKK